MKLSLRQGFTLLELLVAVILVDVGVLALVAGSGIVLRRQAELRAVRTARGIAVNRVEMLASTPCAATSGTSAPARGFTEAWTVTPLSAGRDIRDSVTYSLGTAVRSLAVATRMAC
jgi:Tfp pilus assembly protein PilV